MKRIIHSQEHLIQINRRSAQRTIGLAALLIACIGFATPVLISRAAITATTYDSKAIILVTGDYQLSTSATSIQHSFGTCTSAVGQLFTIQAGTYRMCDGVAFGSPDGVIVYVPTAPAGFYVANWRVTGNSTNGSVSCNTTRCTLNYTAGTANLEVDINATTRPTAPTVSVGGITASSVAFNWTAGSAGSAAFYDYLPYYNGSSNGVTQARSFNWTGLSCGRTVNMKVAIRTSAGNWMSNTASGTTSACAPPPAVATPAPPRPAPATPVPATPVTPKPVVATPRPATSTSQAGAGKSASVPAGQPGAALPMPAADTEPPSTPADFTAQASGTHAVVDLAWTSSSDNVGVSSYHLERSIDQVSWEDLPLSGTATAYGDDSVGFGLQYYYRLQSKDAAGNASPTAAANASVAGFESTSGGSDVTYESPDKLARVLVPAGAFQEEANCSLDTVSNSSGRGTKKKPVVVAGPYRLLCKNASSEILGSSDEPLTWTLILKGQLKGLTKPAVIVYDENEQASDTKEPVIIQKNDTMVFASTSAFAVAAAASRTSYAWVGYVLGAVLLIMGVMAGAWFIIRRSQKVNYSDYLRSKYYDI